MSCKPVMRAFSRHIPQKRCRYADAIPSRPLSADTSGAGDGPGSSLLPPTTLNHPHHPSLSCRLVRLHEISHLALGRSKPPHCSPIRGGCIHHYAHSSLSIPQGELCAPEILDQNSTTLHPFWHWARGCPHEKKKSRSIMPPARFLDVELTRSASHSLPQGSRTHACMHACMHKRTVCSHTHSHHAHTHVLFLQGPSRLAYAREVHGNSLSVNNYLSL